MSDGGGSLRDAALMGIIGLILLAASVYRQSRVDDERRTRAAIHKSRTVQRQREEARKAS